MAKITCPRDQQKLDEGKFHEVPVLHCATCDGVLIKQTSLYPLLTEMARELSKDISFDSEMEPVPDKGAGISCPHCHANMENYGYMGGRTIMIDSCSQCLELWIDTNELATMCFMNERSNKRISRQQEAAREHMKQLDKYVIQEAMHGAFMRGLRLGAFVF